LDGTRTNTLPMSCYLSGSEMDLPGN